MERKSKIMAGVLFATILVAMPVLSSVSRGSVKSDSKKIVLTDSNTLVLNDVIDAGSVPGIISKAKELNQAHGLNRLLPKGKDPIYLFVRSPGGEIQVGLELIEMLKGLDRPVDTITMFGASMAFQTVQQLGKRYIVKNGVLMSHRAKGGFEGELGGQRPSQIDSRKALWESRMDEMDQQTVDRSGGKQTLESYQKAYASELWVTGSQAVAQGYADEVVTVQCAESLSGVTTKTINFMGLINIDYDLDNCPLNSSPMNIRVSQISTNKGSKTLKAFLAEGGEFGSSCLVAAGTDPGKICATDTSLTLERINQLTSQFKSQYENIKDHIVPYGI